MPLVGVREPTNEASENIRAVRDERIEYVVTHRGRPVAVILPLDESWQNAEAERAAAAARASSDFWDWLDALGAQIAAR